MQPVLSNNRLPLTPQPFRSRRAQSIADDLRGLMLSGQLPVGSKLPTETTLCAQFCVSRTTLREAIQMLRSTGLLEVTPGRGSYVRAPSLNFLLPSLNMAAQGRSLQGAETLPLLHLLHHHALAVAPTHYTRQREAIQGLYQHTLVRTATPEECAATEATWHLAVLELAGQPLLIFMGQIVLALGAQARVKKYQQPDEVLRGIQLQLRANTALLEADTTGADRVLGQWCTTPPTPRQHAA